MATPLEGTASGQNAIARVHYTHDGMIDLILAQPQMRQGDIAKYFGFTEGWVSRVMGSDAFNARLAERKTEVVDPGIIASMEERLKGLAIQSIEVLSKKLDATGSPEIAAKSLELTTKALGMGARGGNQTNIQQNTYVVALPPKAQSEQAWVEAAKEEVAATRAAQIKSLQAVDVESRPVQANGTL